MSHTCTKGVYPTDSHNNNDINNRTPLDRELRETKIRGSREGFLESRSVHLNVFQGNFSCRGCIRAILVPSANH